MGGVDIALQCIKFWTFDFDRFYAIFGAIPETFHFIITERSVEL